MKIKFYRGTSQNFSLVKIAVKPCCHSSKEDRMDYMIMTRNSEFQCCTTTEKLEGWFKQSRAVEIPIEEAVLMEEFDGVFSELQKEKNKQIK